VNVAREMKKQDIQLPLIIGGATTSKIHTAVKIEPQLTEPVVHVKDASKSVQVVSALLSEKERGAFMTSVKNEYRRLRKINSSKKEKVITPYPEAKRNRFKIDWDATDLYKPEMTGIKVLKDYPISDIRKFIDWRFFFVAWRLTGTFKGIESVTENTKGEWLKGFSPEDREKAQEALNIYAEAQDMLDRIEKDKMLTANAVFGLFPANAKGDDIVVFADEKREKELTTFHMMRQQQKNSKEDVYLSLADFVAPEKYEDYIGAFAVTAGIGIEKWLKKFEDDNDDYSSILLKSLADRLAEAFAELLHFRVRKEFWGYAKDEPFDKSKFEKEKYRGIRPAMGYPACPDHVEKRLLFDLLGAEEKAGIILTEHFSMYPNASVSGLYFGNAEANYFGIGKVGKDQVKDLAARKGMTIEEVEKWFPLNLGYK